MSKAFTKDDATDEPVVVRARAPLPPGVPNYVTVRGLELLRDEHRSLEGERSRLDGLSDEAERRRATADVALRLAELSSRIATAEIVDPATLTHDAVHFGAHVTIGSEKGERRYCIVGVDEADPTTGRIAFSAPLARALLGKRVGDTVTVRTPAGVEELDILGIDYA